MSGRTIAGLSAGALFLVTVAVGPAGAGAGLPSSGSVATMRSKRVL